MQCSSPFTVGFKDDGKTLAWREKDACREYPTFQLPCNKCLECRLEYGRSVAVRCVHEAQIFGENNSFITLTYSDEHLKSPRLHYPDFQKFMKDLRDKVFRDFVREKFGEGYWFNLSPWEKKEFRKANKASLEALEIGFLVTGEYGDREKRPHWHALLFNYRPSDLEYLYTSDHGDPVYVSKTIDQLWGKNDPKSRRNEIGQVTFESASYCARYSAKKLVHGYDQDHDFHPVHKRSKKHAIGKRYLEKYWRDMFNLGYCVLHDGTKCGIPRYYENWLRQNRWEDFMVYIQSVKPRFVGEAERKETEGRRKLWESNLSRLDEGKPLVKTQKEQAMEILRGKFGRLQKFLKGDL